MNITFVSTDVKKAWFEKTERFPLLELIIITLSILLSLFLKNLILLFSITIIILLLKNKEIMLLFIFLFSRLNGLGLGAIEDLTSLNIFKGITINLGDFTFLLLLIILLKKRKIYNQKIPVPLKIINYFVLVNLLNLFLLAFTPILEFKVGYIIRLFSNFYFAFLLYWYNSNKEQLDSYLYLIIYIFILAFIFQIFTVLGNNLSTIFNLTNFTEQQLKYNQIIVERFRNPVLVFSGSVFYYFLSKFVYKKNNLTEIFFIIVFILSILIGLVRRPLVWAAFGFIFVSFYPKFINKSKRILMPFLLIGLAFIILSYVDIFGVSISIFIDRAVSIYYAVLSNSDTYFARNLENQQLWSFFISEPFLNSLGILFTKNYTQLINANLLDGDVGILEVLIMYGILPTIIYAASFIISIIYAFRTIKITKNDELKLLTFSIAAFLLVFIPFHYNLNNFAYNGFGILILSNNLGLLSSIRKVDKKN